MMDWFKKHLIKIGLAVIVAGFLFELFFAGIPYQDSPEEAVIRYNRNEFIAITTMQIGLALLIIGIVLRLLAKKRKNVY